MDGNVMDLQRVADVAAERFLSEWRRYPGSGRASVRTQMYVDIAVPPDDPVPESMVAEAMRVLVCHVPSDVIFVPLTFPPGDFDCATGRAGQVCLRAISALTEEWDQFGALVRFRMLRFDVLYDPA